MTIDYPNLNGVDLNLLVALDALLSERSVTRAAEKVGLGQSAMSSALARLRRLFDDELLTRVPDGMQPTPRAIALAPHVRSALRQIQSIVRREEGFNPQSAKRTFTIAVPDSVEVLYLPRILSHLRSEAPGVSLVLRPFDRFSLMDDLDADKIDLGVGFLLEGAVHHKQRLLYRDEFVCLFNAKLLGIDNPISLEDYIRFPHVLTSIGGSSRGIVDDALAKLDRTRSVTLLTPRFLAVPFLVRDAPVLTTMAARLANFFAEMLNLTISPPPVSIGSVPTTMVWHSSYDHDPANAWLRELVFRTCSQTSQRRDLGRHS